MRRRMVESALAFILGWLVFYALPLLTPVLR